MTEPLLRWRAVDISHLSGRDDPRQIMLSRRIGNNVETGRYAVTLEVRVRGEWLEVPIVYPDGVEPR